MRLRLPLVAVAAAFALSGCSMLKKTEPPACPQVALLGNADKLTRFRPGPGRDITDIVVEAELLAFQGDCKYTKENVEVTFRLAMEISRGPAASGPVTFDYFIAVPTLFPSKAAKAVYPVSLDFPPNTSKVRYLDEEVSLTLPLKGDRRGQDYQVFIGFQLDGDELQFNRERTR